MTQRSQTPRAFLPIAALGALLLLGGCKDDAASESAADATREKLAQEESVAAAASGIWPSPDAGEIDGLDPMRTRDNLFLVPDMSGSMGGGECAGDSASKADAARAALGAWIATVPEEANVGFAVFRDSRTRTVVPLGTGNRDRLAEAFVTETRAPDGGTPLAGALAHAAQELEVQGLRQEGYGTYRVVMITDGAHSSGEDPRPVVERIYTNPANPIEVSTIGFCVDQNHALNMDGVTDYVSAANPRELSAGLDSVLPESRAFDATDFEALPTAGEGTQDGS